MKFVFPIEYLKRWHFAFKIFGRNLTYKDYKKIFNYLFKKYISGKNLPVSVVFALTYRCQCSCIHCSVGAYKDRLEDELTTDETKNILSFLSEFGIFKVTFFGGEPFLRKDLFELLEYSKFINLRISIDTNGLGLTPIAVRQLKYFRISNINISLDSADPLIHDKLRGLQGCFEAAVNGIKLCVKSGIPCLVSTYASKRSIINGDLKRLIDFSKSLGASGVKILFPILSGRWLNNSDEKLSLEEEAQVRKLLDPSFVYIEDALSMIRNSSERCSSLDRNFFYISPFGDIQLCPAIPFSFGNVRQNKLGSILDKMWNHPISKIQCVGCLMNNEEFRNRYFVLWEKEGSSPFDVYKI